MFQADYLRNEPNRNFYTVLSTLIFKNFFFSRANSIAAIERSEVQQWSLNEFWGFPFYVLYSLPPVHGDSYGPLAPSPCLHISLAGHSSFIPFILFKPPWRDRSSPHFHLGSQSSRKQITPGMSNGIGSVSSRWVANLNLAPASSD